MEVNGGFSVLSKFFGGRLFGFVVMGGMPGAYCCLGCVLLWFGFFLGGVRCYVGEGSSLELVLHGA